MATEAADDVAAAKFSCVKATAILHARPEDVFQLFLDNSRVGEYNEHCRKVGGGPPSAGGRLLLWEAEGEGDRGPDPDCPTRRAGCSSRT